MSGSINAFYGQNASSITTNAMRNVIGGTGKRNSSNTFSSSFINIGDASGEEILRALSAYDNSNNNTPFGYNNNMYGNLHVEISNNTLPASDNNSPSLNKYINKIIGYKMNRDKLVKPIQPKSDVSFNNIWGIFLTKYICIDDRRFYTDASSEGYTSENRFTDVVYSSSMEIFSSSNMFSDTSNNGVGSELWNATYRFKRPLGRNNSLYSYFAIGITLFKYTFRLTPDVINYNINLLSSGNTSFTDFTFQEQHKCLNLPNKNYRFDVVYSTSQLVNALIHNSNSSGSSNYGSNDTIQNVSLSTSLKSFGYPDVSNNPYFDADGFDISNNISNVATGPGLDPSYGLQYFGLKLTDLSNGYPKLGNSSITNSVDDASGYLYNSTFSYDNIFFDNSPNSNSDANTIIPVGPFLTQFVNLYPQYRSQQAPSSVNLGSTNEPISIYDLCSNFINDYNSSIFFRNFNQIIISSFYDASFSYQVGDRSTIAFSGEITTEVKHFPINQTDSPSDFYSPIIQYILGVLDTYKVVQFNLFVVDSSNCFYTQTVTNGIPDNEAGKSTYNKFNNIYCRQLFIKSTNLPYNTLNYINKFCLTPLFGFSCTNYDLSVNANALTSGFSNYLFDVSNNPYYNNNAITNPSLFDLCKNTDASAASVFYNNGNGGSGLFNNVNTSSSNPFSSDISGEGLNYNYYANNTQSNLKPFISLFNSKSDRSVFTVGGFQYVNASTSKGSILFKNKNNANIAMPGSYGSLSDASYIFENIYDSIQSLKNSEQFTTTYYMYTAYVYLSIKSSLRFFNFLKNFYKAPWHYAPDYNKWKTLQAQFSNGPIDKNNNNFNLSFNTATETIASAPAFIYGRLSEYPSFLYELSGGVIDYDNVVNDDDDYTYAYDNTITDVNNVNTGVNPDYSYNYLNYAVDEYGTYPTKKSWSIYQSILASDNGPAVANTATITIDNSLNGNYYWVNAFSSYTEGSFNTAGNLLIPYYNSTGTKIIYDISNNYGENFIVSIQATERNGITSTWQISTNVIPVPRYSDLQLCYPTCVSTYVTGVDICSNAVDVSDNSIDGKIGTASTFSNFKHTLFSDLSLNISLPNYLCTDVSSSISSRANLLTGLPTDGNNARIAYDLSCATTNANEYAEVDASFIVTVYPDMYIYPTDKYNNGFYLMDLLSPGINGANYGTNITDISGISGAYLRNINNFQSGYKPVVATDFNNKSAFNMDLSWNVKTITYGNLLGNTTINVDNNKYPLFKANRENGARGAIFGSPNIAIKMQRYDDNNNPIYIYNDISNDDFYYYGASLNNIGFNQWSIINYKDPIRLLGNTVSSIVFNIVVVDSNSAITNYNITYKVNYDKTYLSGFTSVPANSSLTIPTNRYFMPNSKTMSSSTSSLISNLDSDTHYQLPALGLQTPSSYISQYGSSIAPNRSDFSCNYTYSTSDVSGIIYIPLTNAPTIDSINNSFSNNITGVEGVFSPTNTSSLSYYFDMSQTDMSNAFFINENTKGFTFNYALRTDASLGQGQQYPYDASGGPHYANGYFSVAGTQGYLPDYTYDVKYDFSACYIGQQDLTNYPSSTQPSLPYKNVGDNKNGMDASYNYWVSKNYDNALFGYCPCYGILNMTATNNYTHYIRLYHYLMKNIKNVFFPVTGTDLSNNFNKITPGNKTFINYNNIASFSPYANESQSLALTFIMYENVNYTFDYNRDFPIAGSANAIINLNLFTPYPTIPFGTINVQNYTNDNVASTVNYLDGSSSSWINLNYTVNNIVAYPDYFTDSCGGEIARNTPYIDVSGVYFSSRGFADNKLFKNTGTSFVPYTNVNDPSSIQTQICKFLEFGFATSISGDAFTYPIGFNLQPDFEITYPNYSMGNSIDEFHPLSPLGNSLNPGIVNSVKKPDSTSFLWTDFVKLYNNNFIMSPNKKYYTYNYSSGNVQSFQQQVQYSYPINTSHNYGAKYYSQDASSTSQPWPYIGLGFYFNENLTPQYLFPKIGTDIITNFNIQRDLSKNNFSITDSSFLPIVWDASGVIRTQNITNFNSTNLSKTWPFVTSLYPSASDASSANALLSQSAKNIYSKIIDCEMRTTTGNSTCTWVESGILKSGNVNNTPIAPTTITTTTTIGTTTSTTTSTTTPGTSIDFSKTGKNFTTLFIDETSNEGIHSDFALFMSLPDYTYYNLVNMMTDTSNNTRVSHSPTNKVYFSFKILSLVLDGTSITFPSNLNSFYGNTTPYNQLLYLPLEFSSEIPRLTVDPSYTTAGRIPSTYYDYNNKFNSDRLKNFTAPAVTVIDISNQDARLLSGSENIIFTINQNGSPIINYCILVTTSDARDTSGSIVKGSTISPTTVSNKAYLQSGTLTDFSINVVVPFNLNGTIQSMYYYFTNKYGTTDNFFDISSSFYDISNTDTTNLIPVTGKVIIDVQGGTTTKFTNNGNVTENNPNNFRNFKVLPDVIQNPPLINPPGTNIATNITNNVSDNPNHA